MKKIILLLLVGCLLSPEIFSQNKEHEYAAGMFRGTRIVNGHSVETLKEGEMEFIISHRFGRLNGGGYELFGLDQASIRIGLDYGLTNWLMVGFGRSSLGKEYDFYGKGRILRQGVDGGFPFSLTAFGSASINTLRSADPERPTLFQHRLAFTGQLMIARKFGERFSIQIMPTIAHFNLVENITERNDKIALGFAAKYQLSKNLALTTEYYYTLPNHLPIGKFNSFAIGFDLNTGSHVFQLHFTNSAGMIEKAFIGETTGDWFNGDIHFGFNMVRTFKLKGRRY